MEVKSGLAAGEGGAECDQAAGNGGARGAEFRAPITAGTQVQERLPGSPSARAIGGRRVGVEEREGGIGIGEGGGGVEGSPRGGGVARKNRTDGIVVAVQGGVDQGFDGAGGA